MTAASMRVDVADQEFAAWLASSAEDVARALRKLQSILDRESIQLGAQRLPVTIKPYCISESAERERARASEATLSALSALGQLLCQDDAALALMGFDVKGRALLRLEPGNDALPMSARADTLWTKDHGSFVEMNTDSPALAVVSDVLQSALVEVLQEAGLRFVSECRSVSRTERIVDALLRRYRAHGGTKTDPMIAIVDWTGAKTTAEQRRLATSLKAHGCRAQLFDPSQLSYRGGRLFGGKHEIDLVHRRVLFPEFLERHRELGALVRAVRDGAVAMVNPLKAYLAGNKGILALAHDPEFSGRLPKHQQEDLARFVPHSILVSDENRRMLATADRNEWVIKSSFGSPGSEVVLGSTKTSDEWLAAIEATRIGSWIAQRAVEIPVLDLPVPDGMEWKTEAFWTSWNPWLIDGVYAGATVRCSQARMISISGRGALAASFAIPDS